MLTSLTKAFLSIIQKKIASVKANVYTAAFDACAGIIQKKIARFYIPELGVEASDIIVVSYQHNLKENSKRTRQNTVAC